MPGPLPGFPLITATDWEFAEKTGYRTGQHPAAAQPASGWQEPGDAAGHPAAAGVAPRPLVAEGGADGVTESGADGGADAPAHIAAGRRRSRTTTFAGAGALVIIAIIVPLVLAGMHSAPRPAPPANPTATARPGTSQATAAPTGSASAPPPSAAPDAAPAGLTVSVTGPTATLRWRLAPGNDYPLIVDQPSTGQQPAPLPAGTTSYTVVGLRPGTEYCFKVGAYTAYNAQTATFAWSSVVCATG